MPGTVTLTDAYFTQDGMPKHRHPGAKGWHSVHIKHADASLHATNGAARPKFKEEPTAELKARYAEALAGKSFEYLWGNVARREAAIAAGRSWAYGRRTAEEATPEAPVLDGTAPVVAGFEYEG